MKREEFLLGVCVYLLIILVGHLGPDFTKIPIFNEKLSDLFRKHSQVTSEKLALPMPLGQKGGNTWVSRDLKDPKRSGGYLRTHTSKYHPGLKAKGKIIPYESPLPSSRPIAPISFSL